MKRIALTFLLFILLLALCACSDDNMYSEAELNEAKEEAYQEGYDEATEELQSEIDSAYEEGYESALEEYSIEPGVTWATVYYTPTGECYHMNPSCLSLRDSKTVYECSLEDLYREGSGLRPCDICVPHSDD